MKLYLDKMLMTALPGVPSEMKAIFETVLSPLIRETSGRRGVVRSVRARVDRGTLTSIIQTILSEYPDVYIKTFAGDVKPGFGVRIDIVVVEESKDAGARVLQRITANMKKLIEEQEGIFTGIEKPNNVESQHG
jgi:molybdopterin-biosynthesis enzyme MoeA-like protein